MRTAARKERTEGRTMARATPVKVLFWPVLLTSGTAIGFLLTGITRTLLGS